jgi:hypothetical protein
MDHKGNLFGANTSYRLTWQEKLFMQPEGRILYGKHDYRTGRKEDVYRATKKEDPALLYETRLLVGGKMPVFNKLNLSPYSGIGYRFKSDDGKIQ